jgi:hypothetical protein
MLKSAIATLTVGAGALLSVVTAAPSFAATTNGSLVIGPQVTITVSCPRDHHAVDHSGKLSCARDRRHHHRAVVKTATVKPARPAPQSGALGWWDHCSHYRQYGWPYAAWSSATANSWL